MSEVEWMKIFGDNLKEIMDEQGYTQRDLAEATGLSEASISNYANARTMPTVRAIINLSFELGMPFEDFINFGDRIEQKGDSMFWLIPSLGFLVSVIMCVHFSNKNDVTRTILWGVWMICFVIIMIHV